MTQHQKSTRRKFLQQSSLLLSATLPAVGIAKTVLEAAATDSLQVFVFSKHLQFLDYADMSAAVKEMGFDGIDLTVRPGGHVEPEHVARDLPKATAAMQTRGLPARMVTTKVMDADSATDRSVLRALSQNGYRFYRPGWYRYPKSGPVLVTVQNVHQRLSALAALNAELGLSASYHNHSGNYLGAAIWDLDQALEGLNPKWMGCQYDISHATIEAGKSWAIGLRLIKDHINTLVVKDFVWTRQDGQWNRKFTPLGEGMVDFKTYFSLLKKYGINVPISIHYEYDLGGAEDGGKPEIPQGEVFRRMQKDLHFVRQAWAAA